MSFFKKNLFISFYLILFICFNTFVDSQDNMSQQVHFIKNRIKILENYLKQTISKINEELQEKDALIKTLRLENKKLQNELLILKKKLNEIKKTIEAIEQRGYLSKQKQILEKKVQNKTALKTFIFKDKDVKRLFKQLNSDSISLQINSLLSLSKIKNKEADIALISALYKNNKYVKILACKILGKNRSKIAVFPLLDLVLRENLQIRKVIIKSLNRILPVNIETFHNLSGKRLKKKVKRLKEKLKKEGWLLINERLKYEN